MTAPVLSFDLAGRTHKSTSDADTVSVDRKTILAIKSNLLYDALTILNYSVEVPVFDKKASFLVYHQFPWWKSGQYGNEFCLRFLSLGGEARWWFVSGDKRLTGHFLGLYGESGKYDFQFREKVCRQGEFWSTGISYGYAMPLGRKQKVHLEFSLSAGYASIAFRGYIPSEDYEFLWRDPEEIGRWHYWGPTKAQVSLVVPIKAKTKTGGRR